jgi:hypothetical protein
MERSRTLRGWLLLLKVSGLWPLLPLLMCCLAGRSRAAVCAVICCTALPAAAGAYGCFLLWEVQQWLGRFQGGLAGGSGSAQSQRPKRMDYLILGGTGVGILAGVWGAPRLCGVMCHLLDRSVPISPCEGGLGAFFFGGLSAALAMVVLLSEEIARNSQEELSHA